MSERMDLFVQHLSGILRAPEALPWRWYLLLILHPLRKGQGPGCTSRLPLRQDLKVIIPGCATGHSSLTRRKGCCPWKTRRPSCTKSAATRRWSSCYFSLGMFVAVKSCLVPFSF
jgi:hypothetical protein